MINKITEELIKSVHSKKVSFSSWVLSQLRKQKQVYEFKTSLEYTTNSRIAWALEKDLVSKEKKDREEREERKKKERKEETKTK